MPGALVIGESLIDVVNDGAQGVSILGVPDAVSYTHLTLPTILLV